MNKYMMATTAIHKLGDISSDTEDICHIHGEDENNYIGNWVTSIGFINVKFPKESTRDLTQEEKDYYNSKHYQISDHPSYKLEIE